jgi:hypothetical protein
MRYVDSPFTCYVEQGAVARLVQGKKERKDQVHHFRDHWTRAPLLPHMYVKKSAKK